MSHWDFFLGAISGAGGAIVAFLSRELVKFRLHMAREQFKSSLALRNAINKLRTRKVAAIWREYSTVDAELTAILLARGRIVDEELKAMDQDAKRDVVRARRLPPRAVDRIAADLMPRLQAALEKCSALATL